jgi:glycyl-tRNA synthetase beta chain
MRRGVGKSSDRKVGVKVMRKDLLLEIGLEEVPSAFTPGALEQLRNALANQLSAAYLPYTSVQASGTPRRLVVWAQGLAERQDDVRVENRGPKLQSAYDEAGQPTKALLGFARSQQTELDQLEVRAVGGAEHVFAVKLITGQAAAAVLPALLQDVIQGMTFPKSMRWGYSPFRFARPIRWLLALYGDETVPFTIGSTESGRLTYGHRFLSAGALTAESVPHYFALMKEHSVIVDPVERKARIREQIQAAAVSAGGRVMDVPELLDEVTYLVEYPTAFCGAFSSSYLAVPTEVLTTTMIHNQKYFPLFDGDGQLMARFIGVRNGSDHALDTVRAGNERVIKARLEDALFFWQEDLNHRMLDWADRLSTVTFHEKLGTLQDKAARLQRLAVWIGDTLQLSDAARLQQAARLCKADLLSAMVYEFPELQGIMGRYYALHHGEDPQVADAIREHYLPRFASDSLPVGETGTALALAEKLDNLAGFFMIGARSSGSQDPYALRRQTLGIIHILLQKKLPADLPALIRFAYDGYTTAQAPAAPEQVLAETTEFVAQRLRGVLQEQGYAYDVVDAVLSAGMQDVYDCALRVKSVAQAKQSAYFVDFITVYNRAYNVSKHEISAEVRPELFVHEAETRLWQKLNEIEPAFDQAAAAGKYAAALNLLAGSRPEVDAFFAAVMVMAEDPAVKANRLGLLKILVNRANRIAIFARIVV